MAPAQPSPNSTARKRRRANGDGGIWEEKGRGRWVGTITVGFDDAGKQQRRKVTGKTRGEVVTKLDELKRHTADGLSPAPAELTVARYLNRWLEVPPRKLRPLTVVNYRNVVRLYIVPTIGQVRLRALTPEHVDRMVHDLSTGDPDATPPRRPVSANTQRNARNVLSRALRQAERDGLVPRNVARLSDGVHVPRAEKRSLTIDQARTLLAHVVGTRLEAPITLALSLGLRRGELLALAWDDLTLDGDTYRLTVRHTIKRLPRIGLIREEPKNTTSVRTIMLSPQLAAVMRAHRVRQVEERLRAGETWHDRPLDADLVFRTEDGHAMDPDNFRNRMYRATVDAGIGRWSPHELRHSAASLLIAQGHDLKRTSELLGHSSIRVTADVYGHLFESGKAETAAVMAQVLWGDQ